MKAPHPPRGGCLLIGFLAILGAAPQAFADPKIPKGTLTVDQSLIRVGAQSQLRWQIEYPSRNTDHVDVGAPWILVPKKDLRMRVRLLGSSFVNVKNNNGHGNNIDGVDSSNPGAGGPNKVDTSPEDDDEKTGIATETDYPIELVWSKNGSPWSRIFYGTQSSVVPTALVLNTPVARNDSITFGARGFVTHWMPLFTTAEESSHVLILKDGDPVPAFIPAYKLGLVKGFLKPYLSTDFKSWKLGESDFVIVMELDEVNPNKAAFDLQDIAVLVTFE